MYRSFPGVKYSANSRTLCLNNFVNENSKINVCTVYQRFSLGGEMILGGTILMSVVQLARVEQSKMGRENKERDYGNLENIRTSYFSFQINTPSEVEICL